MIGPRMANNRPTTRMIISAPPSPWQEIESDEDESGAFRLMYVTDSPEAVYGVFTLFPKDTDDGNEGFWNCRGRG